MAAAAIRAIRSAGPDQVAGAQARAHGLGERARVHDAAGLVLLEHGRELLAAEPDVVVRVVLEDRELVLVRELEEPGALLARERHARRVLEVRDDVRERRPHTALEQGLELVDVEAVGLEAHRVQLAATVAQPQQGPVVGRALDDHRRVGLDELVEQERVGLHGTVGDQHVLRLHAVLGGDLLAQRAVAHGGAVAGDPGRIGIERGDGRGLEALGVDDVERRSAPGERDDVGVRHDTSVCGPQGGRRAAYGPPPTTSPGGTAGQARAPGGTGRGGSARGPLVRAARPRYGAEVGSWAPQGT